MNLFSRTPLVSAFVCPSGVFAVVGTRSMAGLEVERVLDVPAAIESETAAADHLVSVLRAATITRANITVTLRGFGVAHHVLQLPPASDDLLRPVIEREVRRLEPELGDCVISWTPLPPLDLGATDTVPQRSVLAAAAPRATVAAIEDRLRASGYRVAHITALPVAMQRLVEEFDEEAGAVALVASLPDGAFIGFSIGGALRLIVEPPLPRDAEHESAALAEELELGAMFVRQQFRGAQLDRIAIVGVKSGLSDAEAVLSDRLHLPAKQLAIHGLSPVACVALGSLLDEQSPRPVSLGGDSRARTTAGAAAALRTASAAALFVLALTGAWTATETVRAVRASDALQTARRRIQQDSFGLAPVRSTANQRRLTRDALAAARVVAKDRIALQEALAGVAFAVAGPVLLDSLHLDRSATGWRAVLGGNATGATNADAIQLLHDIYRELPRRLPIDSLHLDQLTYSDSGGTVGSRIVRFQLSFGVSAVRSR